MKVLLIISTFLTLYICATPCLINTDDRSGSHDSKTYKRKIDSNCECSPIIVNHTYRSIKYWTVYIRLEGHLKEVSKECIGTIVTSNLIATSHKCLTWEGAPTNFFDSWSPKLSPAYTIKPKNVIVSPIPDFNLSQRITVVDILYHPRYLESVVSGKFPAYDIALLKVSDNLLDVFDKKPVCVPTLKEAADLLYVDGFYYGKDPERLYPRQIQFTRILPGSECDKTINKGLLSGLDAVCLKFAIDGPTVEGGALLTRSFGGHFFLTGIASWVGNKHMFAPDEWKFAYFSHVKYFLKYLEYQAHNHKSSWCSAQPAKFAEPKLPSEENMEADLYFGQQVVHKETLDCVCGHTNVGKGGPRIMNGEEAIPFEFGWMVRIIHDVHDPDTDEKLGEANCGGSIINDRIILTAAHCIWDPETLSIPPVERFHAYIRAHMRRDDPHEIEVEIEKTIVHPGYIINDLHLRQFEYDIALLLLAKPLTFPTLQHQDDKSFVPICLPKYDHDYELVGKPATVAGWGVNTTNYTWDTEPEAAIGDPPTLQKLTKPILSLLECQGHMGTRYISDNYICGSVGGDSDSAQGDSGGPLMITEQIRDPDTDPNHHWIQVGIVSFADPQYTEDGLWIKDLAAIYTKVQNFLSFINFYSNKHEAKWCKFETK